MDDAPQRVQRRLKILLYADAYNDRVGQSTKYVEFFSNFGEVILITPQMNLEFWRGFGDILAVPGGADINPARYGEAPVFDLSRGNLNYEYLDTALLRPWIQTGKPIIGICRGLQSLNVELGGTLFQDINGHVGGDNRTAPLHQLCTAIPGYENIRVNSFHHQAIKELGEGLEVLGWSPIYKGCPSLREREYLVDRPFPKKDDSTVFKTKKLSKKERKRLQHLSTAPMTIVKEEDKPKYELFFSIPEIVIHSEKPYVAFQYHPEETSCDLAMMLIDKVINSHFYPDQNFEDDQQDQVDTDEKTIFVSEAVTE